MSGLLFVLSGPSGVGKSTLRKEVMKRCPALKYSISYTSRAPRRDEKEGVDYYFVDMETFEEMKEKGEFIEWAKVHGNYYGTPRRQVEEWLKEGFDVILEIDVQGAKQVKNCSTGFSFLLLLLLKNLRTEVRRGIYPGR